jgi:hypothetical protein
MGTEQQMFARECWTKEEFEAAVKQHLTIPHRVEATPIGLSNWEVRAGFVYEIRETRKVKLSFQDIDGKKTTLDIPGNKDVEEIKEIFRKQRGTRAWVKIHIKRQDAKPFFIEDGGKHSIWTEYVPEDDPEPEILG